MTGNTQTKIAREPPNFGGSLLCIDLILTTMTECADDMQETLKEGPLAKTHASIQSFIQEIRVEGNKSVRLKNGMNLTSLLEIKKSPEEQAEIIIGLFKKVGPIEENEE